MYKYEMVCISFYAIWKQESRAIARKPRDSAATYDSNTALALRASRGNNKKAQLSLTNPRDACETFARFT